MAGLKILISAGASPVAVSIIRHLAALGHKVYAMDASKKALPMVRGIAHKVLLSPLADDPGYIAFISERMQTADLFIPFIDEEIDCLVRHGDAGLWERCLLPEMDTAQKCIHKKQFQAFCIEKNLPVASAACGVPAVFKPDLGRGGRGVVIIRTPEALAGLSGADGVLQAFVPGKEYTVDALFSKTGRLIRISARSRDTASGVSTIGTIADPGPFYPVVEQLAGVFAFRYLVNIQFIKDCSGRLHIIEINPRVAGSIMFTVYSGLDFLRAAIDIYRGIQPQLPGVQKKIRVLRYWSEHVEDLET